MPSPIDFCRIIRPAIKHYNRGGQAVPDDDCSSTASTVLVDLFSKTQAEHSSTSSTAKKYVHFSTEPNQYHDPTISVLTPELVAECWYPWDEIQTFRQQTIALSQHVVQVERLNRAPFSYQRVLERTFEQACGCGWGVRTVEAQDDDDDDVVADGGSENPHLQRWLDVADCRLGLERLCVPKIARDKTTRRVALRRLMRQERRRQQQQQILDKNNDPAAVSSENRPPNEERAEWLRKECGRYSRPSRMFARTMAEALAAVIRNNDERESSFLLPSAIEFLSPASAGIEV